MSLRWPYVWRDTASAAVTALSRCAFSAMTVGWVFWPVKPVRDITYNVFSGTLNVAQLNVTVYIRQTAPALFKTRTLSIRTLRHPHFCPAFHQLSHPHSAGPHFTMCPLNTGSAHRAMMRRSAFSSSLEHPNHTSSNFSVPSKKYSVNIPCPPILIFYLLLKPSTSPVWQPPLYSDF